MSAPSPTQVASPPQTAAASRRVARRRNRTREPRIVHWYSAPPPAPVQLVAYDAQPPLQRLMHRVLKIQSAPRVAIAQPEAVRTDNPPRYEFPILGFTSQLPPPRTVESAPAKQLNLDSIASFQVADADDSAVCVICLDKLSAEPVSQGTCRHMVHTTCLKDWLRRDPDLTCPVCRIKSFDSIL